jgi:hypothetical protein
MGRRTDGEYKIPAFPLTHPARTLSRARDGKTPKRDKKEAPALGRGLESREETPKEGKGMDRTF